MKSKLFVAIAMVFLIPSLAMAGTKKSANVVLDQPVNAAGTQLAPGEYKLTWDGTGPNVTVSFIQGKKTIASAPAKLVTTRNEEEAIETANVTGNTTALRAIDLKNMQIQFENPASASGN